MSEDDPGYCPGHSDNWTPGEHLCPVCGAWYMVFSDDESEGET